MSAPEKLPDDFTHIFGKPMHLTERELVSHSAPIGPKGEWVQISYVVSRMVSA